VIYLVTEQSLIKGALIEYVDVTIDRLSDKRLLHLEHGDIVVLDGTGQDEWDDVLQFANSFSTDARMLVFAPKLLLSMKVQLEASHVLVLLGEDLTSDDIAQSIQSLSKQMNALVEVSKESHLNTSPQTSLRNTDAVEKTEPPEAQSPQGKVVAFMSLRLSGGGVGKSTLVVNLAAKAAKAGQSVAVIELDAGGVLRGRLGVKPTLTVGSWIQNYGHVWNMDKEAIRLSLTPTSFNFSVLLSDRNKQQSSVIGLDMNSTQLLIERIRSAYDLVILDLPGSLTPSVYASLWSTDRVFLVGSGDSSQWEAYGHFIQTWVNDSSLVHLEKVRFVLNLVEKKKAVQEFEEQVGVKVVAAFVSDRSIHQANEQKSAFVAKKPNHPFSKGVQRLLQDIGITASEPQKKWRRWG
jgi:MinD-like ATPase involved in chromosome partitioning or flagellar assembly